MLKDRKCKEIKQSLHKDDLFHCFVLYLEKVIEMLLFLIIRLVVISNSFSIKEKLIITLEFITFINVTLKLLYFILVILVYFTYCCVSLHKQQ